MLNTDGSILGTATVEFENTDQVKTEQERMKEFVDDLNALYAKHGYQVAAAIIPVSTNHGTWELGIQMSIVKLEPK